MRWTTVIGRRLPRRRWRIGFCLIYLRSGPAHLVSNADVVMRMWQAGDEILPVTYRASPPADQTADVCSPWNHYVRYPIEEIDRHRGEPTLSSLVHSYGWAACS